jgi:hypothetical protein
MATNRVSADGYQVSVVCSDPTTPQTGGPVRYGYLTGVALTDEAEGGNPAGYTSVDFGPRVWNLSVKGVDGNGNSAVAVGDVIYYVDADTPKLSKKTAGYVFGVALEAITSGATATIKVMKIPGPGSGAFGSGTVGAANLASDAVETLKIAANAVTAAKLTATMAIGFIPLDITTARLLSTNAIANTVEGYVPDGNTAPLLERVNGATDKALRLKWAASASDEIAFAPFVYPPDLDDAAAVEVHILAASGGATNSPVVAVGFFEGVGDTNAGGNTAAVTGTSVAEYSVSIAHGDVGAAPKAASVTLTPAAHTTDALYLYGAWIEYTRK